MIGDMSATGEDVTGEPSLVGARGHHVNVTANEDEPATRDDEPADDIVRDPTDTRHPAGDSRANDNIDNESHN